MRLEVSRWARMLRHEIWAWNFSHYETTLADRYFDGIFDKIDRLLQEKSPGRPVVDDPVIRYIGHRRSRTSYGHVIVFRLESDVIRVTGIYHTAQDWRTKPEEL